MRGMVMTIGFYDFGECIAGRAMIVNLPLKARVRSATFDPCLYGLGLVVECAQFEEVEEGCRFPEFKAVVRTLEKNAKARNTLLGPETSTDELMKG